MGSSLGLFVFLVLNLFWSTVSFSQQWEVDVIIYGFEYPLRPGSVSYTATAVDLAILQQTNWTIKMNKIVLGGLEYGILTCDDVDANIHLVAEYVYENVLPRHKNAILLLPGI